MKATGRKMDLLVWPAGYPEGLKEEGAPERPFILRVSEYDYALPVNADEIEDYGKDYVPEPELGFRLSDLYEPLQTGIVERTQVQLPSGRIAWLWVDEEGHLRHRQINRWATDLYWSGGSRMVSIVGTVALELPDENSDKILVPNIEIREVE